MATDTTELLFLTHPGTNLFSGYGLPLHNHRRDSLVGLLMMDRPTPSTIAWLEEVVRRYGNECELYPVTESGRRGLACQMYIEDDSISLIRGVSSPDADIVASTITHLLEKLPKPQCKLFWDEESQAWISSFYQDTRGGENDK
jgi:hypothetical protein